MGSLEDFVYTVGISKRVDTDITFHEVQEDPIIIDRMFTTAPYRIRLSHAPYFISSSQREEIRDGIEEIVRQANSKRVELYNIMSENPYLPYHKKVAPLLYHAYFSMIGRFLRIPVLSVCMAITVFLLTGHAFIFIFMICFVFAVFLDFITCRLLTSRGSPNEQQWIVSAMKSHPELNSLEIDRHIQIQLDQLGNRLMEKYPSIFIDCQQIMEKTNSTSHRKNPYSLEDKFFLKIRERSSFSSNPKRPPGSMMNPIHSA